MKLRRILALTTLALAPLAANATLTTLTAPWPPTGSTGLDGVEFNVQTNAATGVMVAMGAHPYKNGATMPNDGISTFYAPSGIYAADGLGRANWSFDFAWNLGTGCGSCKVVLSIDQDPSSAIDYVSNDQMKAAFGSSYAESWNLTMGFIPFTFDPFGASDTNFLLQVLDADGAVMVESGIRVLVGSNSVPEPSNLALAGLGLAAAAFARRRALRK
ncbi:PEP-CTERM sorting domain-containing protein [Paucibacter sp. R3-3]|uniref:PEP-CTERM sorting domain-containing protein n=1 Tax=Roseateles agri TaxID=3098619 RepID=A0ABU5DPH7_9BURK|nr:PEP-CTERM sorting domain-containing protein [Paucibacter sp. R3-3]MDY0747179.1 PEP-CTERM sorting domain-containing protein [Paucibacter sp. R3-3]